MNTPSSHRQTAALQAGFTLIELLIVISIIAILAGLAFPAVQGALGQGKKAQARNDVNQIATAIKAFQLEYGRLPGTNSADGPAPTDWITTLTSSNSQNPRGIVFFEPKLANKQGKGGLVGNEYKDPWGNTYTVILDGDYNNKVKPNLKGLSNEYFTTVVVWSPGGTNASDPPDKDVISNVK